MFYAWALLLVPGALARANALFSSGTLSDPNQIFQFEFTLSNPANVTVSTLASNLSTPWVDTNGSFEQGGFDPVVWVFSDENYNQSTTQFGKDDDICTGVTGVNYSGCGTSHVFDAQVTVALSAGTYVAVVSTAGDPSEAQYADGQHFFKKPDFAIAGWSYDGTFDFGSDPVETRTGYYQLTVSADTGTITEVTSGTGVVFPNHGYVTEVPEPAPAAALLLGALSLLAVRQFRKKRLRQ